MDKKELIIQSAIKLFCAKGFEGTSVREIAADANINVAMINYYFDSKEKLFESIVEYKASFLKGLFNELVNQSSLTPIEKIDKIIESYVDRLFSSREFHHLLQRELSLEHRPKMRDSISDILLKNVSPVKAIIQDGINVGVFKPVDVELTISTIIGTVNHLLISETMCKKLLNKPKNFNPFQNKKLKERLNEHLQQLMRAHLLKNKLT